jgi:hypothetical protein
VTGSSYASQDGSTTGFGLASAAQGTLETFWPGGIRNRLYDVESGERLTVPAIPCSFDGPWATFGQYNACVLRALNAYKDAGVLTDAERNRLRDSARRAFDEEQ